MRLKSNRLSTIFSDKSRSIRNGSMQRRSSVLGLFTRLLTGNCVGVGDLPYRLRRFPKCHRLVSVPPLTELGKRGLMAARKREIILP